MNKTRPHLHFDPENSYLYHLGIALLPIIIYGFYKNGILPFINHDLSFFGLVRPILFPLIGLGIGALVDYLIWWQTDNEEIWTHRPLYGLLIFMTIPINANLIVSSILLFFCFLISSVIFKKWKVSSLFFSKLIFVLFLSVLAGVSFLNKTESSHTMIYGLLDTFFGRSVGGLSTTSIFWIIIAYIYLAFEPYYKKDIPIYIIVTYIILSLIMELMIPTGNLIKTILNSSVFFASVFLASEMKHSPFMEKSRIIYGILIGFFGFFLTRFFNSLEGIYISIFFVSLFVPFIDYFISKQNTKDDKFCRNQKSRNFKLNYKILPKLKITKQIFKNKKEI